MLTSTRNLLAILAVIIYFTWCGNAVADGSALLSWTPPTKNEDNSNLTDLAGYKIYYGTVSNNYTETISINDPNTTSYEIDNLTPAYWYFTVTSLNSSNVESAQAAEVSKEIN